MPSKDHQGRPAEGATLRTVLVDDVDEMRDLVRALLRRDGRFSIVGEAANGLDALEVVADLRPDLVVLDIDMPVLDGLATVPRHPRAVTHGPAS